MPRKNEFSGAIAALRGIGIDNPAREARLLLAHALGVPANTVLDTSGSLPPEFATLMARRMAHEPMALILGRQGFWTLDLEVSPATLIPRADSETLIEAALEVFSLRAAPRRILDLGTGTGCLLLACLSAFPEAWGVGVDIAADAALLAARNAAANGLAGRAAFLCANWADALDARFDLVLSNPPYIERGAIAGLMPEVAGYEPCMALDGGKDGLDAYRDLTKILPHLLAPAGIAILELGQGQDQMVEMLASAAGLHLVKTRRDLAGIPRALVLAAP